MQNRETLDQYPCLSLPGCPDRTAAFSGCLTWSRECWQHSSLPFFFFLIVLGLCCCMRTFSSCGEQGLLSGCYLWASHCSDVSCCRAQALGAWASGVAACGLGSCSYPRWLQCVDHCGPQAQLFPMHVEPSYTRDQTRVPYFGRWILNPCTIREVFPFFLKQHY